MAAAKKRPNRRRRQVEEWESFLFEIQRVHPHYSFGDGHEKLNRTAFSEYLHPEFDANCLAPERFRGRHTTFTLLGDRSDEQDLWAQTPADTHDRGVGTLTFRGERSQYLGSIPFDVLWNVVLTTLAGGFRYIYLHGPAMKRGTSRITSISFYEEFDVDEA